MAVPLHWKSAIPATGGPLNTAANRRRRRESSRAGLVRAASAAVALGDLEPASSPGHPPPPIRTLLSWGIRFTAGVSPYAETQGRRRPGTRSQASSSFATRSDHLGAEGRGTETRVRQSVLYSDRLTRPRHTRGSSLHPTEGAGTRTHVPQSVLCTDRPRQCQPRRPAVAEDHPRELGSSELHTALTDFLTDCDYDGAEVSSSELGRAVKDSPPLERLSLSDKSLFTPQPAEEIHDYFDELDGHGRRYCYSMQPEGVIKSTLLSLDDLILTTLPDMDQPRPDSDVDSEEFLRELQEYLDSFPEDFEDATRTTLAGEWGTEPPEPPREPFPVDQEAQSVQVPEQASAVAALARHGVAPTESRAEASMEEIIRNGRTWMDKEVMLCFEKHVERSEHLAGLKSYRLDELLHQCFNVESYNKVYHHYNFTVKMKKPNSDDWAVELYFAEVKEMFGRKYHFCYPLEPNENGSCYACQSQGVEELKHPAIGGFLKGSPGAPGFGLWYTDE